jgi:arylsulfatase A-like enzyme
VKRRGLLLARVTLGVLMLALFVSQSMVLLAARRDSARSTMPRSHPEPVLSAGQSPGGAVANGSNLGVAIRFVDQLGAAKIDVPRIGDRQIRGLLSSHWRRHLAPFAGPGGDLGRLVQHIGLSRHGTAVTATDSKGRVAQGAKAGDSKRPLAKAGEVKGSNAKATSNKEGGRKPGSIKRQASPVANLGESELRERNVKTFGLGDGSYDQRECILAPPPATLRYKVQIPAGAKWRAAPAVLGEGEVTFTLGFRPSIGGERRVLGTTSVRGPSRRYSDWTIELDAAGIGNSEGELELLTESKSREPLIALWGSPVVIAPRASRLPYNVLMIIVDAMRSDAISATHDPDEDQRRKHAKYPPLDAWFDAMPEVAPELDRLALQGTTWAHSWSAAMWTRPATLSLLTGLRASHTGLEILALELIGDQRRNFYARRPPLLPVLMRRAGATTTALVNNMYLSGSVGVGVDFGFESVVDHRLQTLDTRNITEEALRFLTDQGKERFLLLLNYASPHAPYSPPHEDLRAVSAAAHRPSDHGVLNYLGEVHKDDAAIGQVLNKLDELKLRDNTIVVVTADHGETMSAAHDIVAVDVAQGVPSGRFTHLSTMWEEAARVAMIMALPGKIPSGKRLEARAQTIDLMPTILELEGLQVPSEIDGRSLLAQFAGKPAADRPVVIEGRGARSIIDGKYHLVLRDPIARRLRYHQDEYELAVELYDLEMDPGECKDIAARHPDVVASLRAKLERVLSEKPSGPATAAKQRLHLRFATAGKSSQLEFLLRARADTVQVIPVGIEPGAVRLEAEQIRILTATNPDRAVGFDLELRSTTADVAWEVKLEGKPWPVEHVYAGPLGIAEPGLLTGLHAGLELSHLDSQAVAHIVAAEETGMFVTRDPIAGPAEVEASAEAALEAQQAIQAWGYARKPAAKHGP